MCMICRAVKGEPVKAHGRKPWALGEAFLQFHIFTLFSGGGRSVECLGFHPGVSTNLQVLGCIGEPEDPSTFLEAPNLR